MAQAKQNEQHRQHEEIEQIQQMLSKFTYTAGKYDIKITYYLDGTYRIEFFDTETYILRIMTFLQKISIEQLISFEVDFGYVWEKKQDGKYHCTRKQKSSANDYANDEFDLIFNKKKTPNDIDIVNVPFYEIKHLFGLLRIK
jgi:predicted Rdx family selenoprotein